MEYLFLLYLVPLSLIIAWCATRTIQRMRKRKAYGKKLAVVKDVTSNLDLFWGIVFLIPAIRLIIIFMGEDIDFFTEVIFMWPIYMPMISIVKFTQAFSKIEIYEKGILSKDRLWAWDSTDSYSLKEDSKTVTYNFKLNKKIFKSGTITVLKRDKEKVENAINEMIQIM